MSISTSHFSANSAAITCHDLTFEWPSGEIAIDHLSAAFPAARTGLVGVNGTGKTTLLRLIAGELPASSGEVRSSGTIGYLPQDLPRRTNQTVSDLLGISTAREALLAIERGETDPELFDAIGNDWDISERARALLDSLGLSSIELDREGATLSGGELTLTALTGILLARPDILLLDEPTNNLDSSARERVYDVIERFNGVLVMVSHDREALRHLDAIAELRDGHIEVYGGNFDDFRRRVEQQQAAAERDVRDARSDVAKQKRELIEAQEKIARRDKHGRKVAATSGDPKILLGARKRAAQVSAGKHKALHQDRLTGARAQLSDAETRLREEDEIKITLPETAVPSGRIVLELTDAERLVELREGLEALPLPELVIRGPERIALSGSNGSGKTTLLSAIAGSALVPVQRLSQRLDGLDDGRSVLENVTALAPHRSTVDIRNRLAQFLLRGESVNQPAGTLSGGQRLRAILAAVLMADPAPQLLLLDEPTNNLDLASVRHLAQALRAYRGALIVVSHDRDFLDELELERWLRVVHPREEAVKRAAAQGTAKSATT